MLLSDASPSTLPELMENEPEITTLVKTDKLVFEGKHGIIRVAGVESMMHLQALMNRNRNNDLVTGELGGRMSRTRNSLSSSSPLVCWEQVYVDGPDAPIAGVLRAWFVQRTLAKVYRICTNRIGDRYQAFYEEVTERLRSTYWPLLEHQGVPIVMNPLAAPGALFQKAGVFDASAVSISGVAGTIPATVYVAVTWTAANDVESYTSNVVEKTLIPTGSSISISLSKLIPPNGTQNKYTHIYAKYQPLVANGWNVYVGTSATALFKQNDVPLTLGSVYTLSNLLTDTELSGEGQQPDTVLNIDKLMQRG